jgi:hypothetical protein
MTVTLNRYISKLKKDNLKNLTILSHTFPGFNNQTLSQLEKELKDLKERLLIFASLFDPSEKWIKKDYDPSIYFVEELNKINRSLKLKAVNYPGIGFKEKIPNEKEAVFLLRQLYQLNEVINKGIDCNINFNSINPQPPEDWAVFDGMKIAKSEIKFNASAPAVIEFIIQISEIIPLVSIESFTLEVKDSSLNVGMTLSQIIIDADWKEEKIPISPLEIKSILGEKEDLINILRANNSFLVSRLKEPGESISPVNVEPPKQLPRFLYRGKAILNSKEVAVIEDTLNQETLFLSPEERIDDFILKDLKDEEIIMEDIKNEKEIIITREGG